MLQSRKFKNHIPWVTWCKTWLRVLAVMYEYVLIIPSVIQPCWHYIMETEYKGPRLPGILLKRMTLNVPRGRVPDRYWAFLG